MATGTDYKHNSPVSITTQVQARPKMWPKDSKPMPWTSASTFQKVRVDALTIMAGRSVSRKNRISNCKDL